MKTFKIVLATLAGPDVAGATAIAAEKKGTVGISMPTKSSLRWIADGNNMVAALKEKGYNQISSTPRMIFPINWRRSRTWLPKA